jgi:hypothetical protein
VISGPISIESEEDLRAAEIDLLFRHVYGTIETIQIAFTALRMDSM